MRVIEHHGFIMELNHLGGRKVVLAREIRAAASLLKMGYALAEDSHDGPEIYLTEAGQKYITRAEVARLKPKNDRAADADEQI